MQKVFVIAVSCFIITVSQAQPYLDIASIGYTNSPDAAAWPRTATRNSFKYYYTGFNLPILLGKDSSAIILSPFAERWNMKIDSVPDLPAYMQSLALQVTFSKALAKQWSIYLSVIPRWNGNRSAIFTNDFQLGGAFLVSYKRREGLIWKFGMYYNRFVFVEQQNSES